MKSGGVTADTVPDSWVDCVPTASTTVSVVARLPAALVSKLIEMVQLAPAARETPQLFEPSKNADALLPVSPIEVMDRAADPELLSVTVCAGTNAPMLTLPKLIDDGVRRAFATSGAVLVPESDTVIGAAELFRS